MNLLDFDDDRVKLLFQFLSLYGSGIITGFSAYITLVELPSRKNDTSHYQLQNYQHVFPLAAGFMKPFGVLVTLLTAVTLYGTGNTIWAVPLIVMGALGPFTVQWIKPTNDILMATEETNSQKVRKELADWTRLHNIRTYMSLVGFAGACLAALTGK